MNQVGSWAETSQKESKMVIGWEQYEAIYVKFINFEEDGPSELLRDIGIVVKVPRYTGEHKQCFEGWGPFNSQLLCLCSQQGPGQGFPSWLSLHRC